MEQYPANSAPTVSIIIVNFGRPQFLRDCVRSVLENSYQNLELILTDYDPLNRPLELPADSRLRTIHLQRNVGFASGCNLAYGSIRTQPKYLVLLNNDVRVSKDWLDSLVQFMETNSKVGCAQSLILDYAGQEIVSSGQFIDKLGNTYTRHKGHSAYPANERRIFYPNGASLIVRTSLLRKIGLFDPDYFMYYEDVDLGWRTWLTGAEVALVGNSIAYHAVGGSVERLDQRANSNLTYHMVKNHVATLLKNYEWPNALFYTAVYLSLLLARIFLEWRNGETQERAIIYPKVALWTLIHCGKIVRKRQFTQAVRRMSDSQCMAGGLIIDISFADLLSRNFQLA